MHDFYQPFAQLLLRSEASLTAEDRVLIEYCEAFIDVMDACNRRSEAHRWNQAASRIFQFGWTAGREPLISDPGVRKSDIAWIAAQREVDLNAFQVACLESFGWWSWVPSQAALAS